MTRTQWTPEEEQILSIYYGKISAREIHERFLPARTREAIKLHARLLDLDGNQNLLNKIYHTKYDESTKEKHCTCCKHLKSISEFRVHKRGDDIRIESACIECENIKSRERWARKPEWRHRQKSYHQKRREVLREKIIKHYGGKCTCPHCPETNVAFLTIEHMNGGGTKHRKDRGELGVYKDIIDRGFPDDITILCYNCNCGKAHQKDNVCPHLLAVSSVSKIHG